MFELKASRLTKMFDETVNKWKYVYDNSKPDKNHPGGINFKPRANSEFYEQKDSRNPILWLDCLLAARPTDAPDNLFLVPRVGCANAVFDPENAETLFSINPMTESKLSKFMNKICEEAGIPASSLKKISNHAGRTTMATCLHTNDVQNQLIMEKGGWRSEEGARNYKHTSSAQKFQVDTILHEHVNGPSSSSTTETNISSSSSTALPLPPLQVNLAGLQAHAHQVLPNCHSFLNTDLQAMLFQQQQFQRVDQEARERLERCDRECERKRNETRMECDSMIQKAQLDIALKLSAAAQGKPF